MSPQNSLPDVYQLKISLRGAKPPIWRRVLAPATMSFSELHDVIQIAMGWFESHLHEFKVANQSLGDPEWDEMGDMIDEGSVRLGNFVFPEGARFLYIYDFGDWWEHLIEVEKVLPYDKEQIYPVCTQAKRACPPEDVGGIWGYEEFLAAIGDKNHPDHADMLEWVGDDFDPAAVDINGINAELENEYYSMRWTLRKL